MSHSHNVTKFSQFSWSSDIFQHISVFCGGRPVHGSSEQRGPQQSGPVQLHLADRCSWLVDQLISRFVDQIISWSENQLISRPGSVQLTQLTSCPYDEMTDWSLITKVSLPPTNHHLILVKKKAAILKNFAAHHSQLLENAINVRKDLHSCFSPHQN